MKTKVIYTDNPPFNQKGEVETKETPKAGKDELYGGNPLVYSDALEQMKNVRKLLKDRLKPVKDNGEAIEDATATEKVRLQGSKESKIPSLKPYTEAVDVKDRASLSKLVEKAKKEKKLFKIGRSMKEGFRYTFLIEEMVKEEAKPEFKVGNTVKIISMAGEPEYTGKVGKITKIDDAGQLHGTWGGLALIPGDDKFELVTVINHDTGKVEENKKVKEALTEEEKEVSTPHFELMNNEMGKIMAFFKGSKTAFESAVEIGKTIHGKNGGYRKEDKFVVIEKKHPSGVSLFSSSDGDMRDALMLSSMGLEEAFFFGEPKGTEITSFEQSQELGKGAFWPIVSDKKYLDMYINKGYKLYISGSGKDRVLTLTKDGEIVNAYDVNDKVVALENLMKSMPKMEGAPEEHHHDEEHKDEGEYDEEGDMAKSDLQIMADAALELHGMLADEENLPEWVQAKITLATDYIDTARDYMKAKKDGKDFPEPKEDEEENLGEAKKPLGESSTGSWGKEVITLQEFATAVEKLGRDDIDVFPILKGIAAGTHRAFVKHEGKDTTITVLRGDVVEKTLTSKKEVKEDNHDEPKGLKRQPKNKQMKESNGPKGELYERVVFHFIGDFGPEHFYDLDNDTIGITPIPGNAKYDATLWTTRNGSYALAMFKDGEELNTDELDYFDTAEEAALYALDTDNYDALEGNDGDGGLDENIKKNSKKEKEVKKLKEGKQPLNEMLIDLILERKDGFKYNPETFYRDAMQYSGTFDGIADAITRAMDEGTEEDVKKALCKYVLDNDYNPEICDYINSVTWLEADLEEVLIEPKKGKKESLNPSLKEPINDDIYELKVFPGKDGNKKAQEWVDEHDWIEEHNIMWDAKRNSFILIYKTDEGLTWSSQKEIANDEQKQKELKKEEMEPRDSKFFPGEDGDTEAHIFIEDKGIEDFDLMWDDKKGGYVLTWESKEEMEEMKEYVTEERHGKEEKKHLKEETKILSSLNEFEPWSGAVSTWDLIVEADKVDALDFMLEDLYPEGITSTELNDLLWFESGWILDVLKISGTVSKEKSETEEETKEEETEEGKEDFMSALNDIEDEPVVNVTGNELEEAKHAHHKKENQEEPTEVKEEVKESTGNVFKEVQDFIAKTVSK
jgi:hypothetical protein